MEFLIFLAAGLIVFGAVYVIATLSLKRSAQGIANWPQTSGQIRQAFVYRHERRTPKETTVTFTPVVEYVYTVGERQYTSRKREFVPYDRATYTDEQQAAAVLAALPPGKAVTVWYNPDVPQQAALKVEKPHAHNFVLFFGIVNMIVGALLIGLAVLLM